MPTSTKAGSGHSSGRMRRTPGLAVRILLDERAGGQPHGLLGLLAHGSDSRLVDEAELGHLGRDAAERVAGPPRGLLLLGRGSRTRCRGRGRSGGRSGRRAPRRRPGPRPRAASPALAASRGARRAGPCRRPARPGCRSRARAPTAAAPRWPPRTRGRDRVEVVLDEEAERQPPRGRQVEALQHRADVDRAVAEVGDREVVGAGVLLRPGVAGRHRHAAPDDGVGAERPGLEPLQVHGAAASAAVALGEPEDLGERALQHGLDLRRHEVRRVEHALGHVRDGLGQELVMAAMGAVDGVGRPAARRWSRPRRPPGRCWSARGRGRGPRRRARGPSPRRRG